MSKTRKTITVDAELARLVDNRDEFNLSGFVNRCLEQHFGGQIAATPEKAALKAELEELEEELADLDQKRQRLRDERQDIEQRLDEQAEQEPELLDQARTKLQGTPRDPDNPAVQNWAGKLGIPADQLINELEANQ
jgi:DNA repair exonuclease SbcCD ATPase subunit